MSWTLSLDTTTIPGSIIYSPSEVSAASNFLVLASDINEVDVQSYGVLILQIFNFDIGGEYMTFASKNCYTRCEVMFNPSPFLGSNNIRWGFYAGLKTKPRNIQLWTELL